MDRRSPEYIRTPLSEISDSALDSPSVLDTETLLLQTAQKLVTSERKKEIRNTQVWKDADRQNRDISEEMSINSPTLDPLSVIRQLDDETNIAKNLQDLALEKQKDNLGKGKTISLPTSVDPVISTNPITPPTPPTVRITPPTPVVSTKPNSKRPRVDSDEALEPIPGPSSRTDPVPRVQWSDIVEEEESKNSNNISEYAQELRDVRKYLPSELMLHYKDARREVKHRVLRAERVKFVERCIQENVIIKDLQYFPTVPQGLDLSTQEIITWEGQVRSGERALQLQYKRSLTRLATQSDVAATKHLQELQEEAKKRKVPESNLKKVYDIMSSKIGKARAQYKLNLDDQFRRNKDEYEITLQNNHFLRRGVPRSNLRSNPPAVVPHGNDQIPTIRGHNKNQSPVRNSPSVARRHQQRRLLEPQRTSPRTRGPDWRQWRNNSNASNMGRITPL